MTRNILGNILGTAAITAIVIALAGPQAMAQDVDDTATSPEAAIGAAPPPPAAADAAPASTGPVCEGASSTRWIAGAKDVSDPSQAESPLQMQVETGGGVASGLIGFTISADSQDVRVEAMADGDPAIMLMTSDGDEIATNDDTATSLNSRIDTTLGPGDYCIGTSSIGDERINITLQVARSDQPSLLNEDEEEAAAAPSGISACTTDTEAAPLADAPLDAALTGGAISMRVAGAETSYLRFTLAQATPLTLRVTSEALDPHMALFDGAGALIAENDDDDEALDSRLDFPNMLSPGDYCIGAAALDPRDGDLIVSAERLDPTVFLRAAWRRGDVVPPADADYPVQILDLAASEELVLLHDGSAQWFAFQIDQPTVIIVRAFGSFVGIDPMLRLFNTAGVPIEEADDQDGSTDAVLGPLLVEPGSYHMALIDAERRGQQGGPMRPIGVMFERYLRVK